MEHAVKDLMDKWQENVSSLEPTAPLKLHVLATHVLDFTKIHRATPAACGERDGESANRVFSRLKDTFRMLGWDPEHCATP